MLCMRSFVLWFIRRHFEVVDPSDVKDAAKLFSVPDFVGDACKAIASRVRGAVAGVQFDDFHKVCVCLSACLSVCVCLCVCARTRACFVHDVMSETLLSTFIMHAAVCFNRNDDLSLLPLEHHHNIKYPALYLLLNCGGEQMEWC